LLRRRKDLLRISLRRGVFAVRHEKVSTVACVRRRNPPTAMALLKK